MFYFYTPVFRGYRNGILAENVLNLFDIFGSLHLPPQPDKRDCHSRRAQLKNYLVDIFWIFVDNCL